ncbi:DUF1294 domain-containing protein [Bowmanella sp. Y26]|uniref:DUF1294 domain-containing protein n=1 Tax=Bowmanella yangjiangensis TaxID=2811230 RepID=UPI001BDCEAF8|nr:cold shock and DUF1294 domain-containing protein [Bowmanella yangjiangensis]MBT1063317.1 DUF1294 domain-containing protein [Bowmanella yangjiangensis]
MKYQGKLTNWNDEKGFGFVEPNGGGNRAFVHIKAFVRTSRRPMEGDLIVYEPVLESPGKYKATNISLAIDRKAKKHSALGMRKLGTMVVLAFCALLTAFTLLKILPVQVLLLYLGASLIAFVMYALDKSAAQHNRWRTPESSLHMCALLGGWPGAFYAQNKLRHKSSKASFKRMYWATVVVNLAAFFWLLSESGKQFLALLPI